MATITSITPSGVIFPYAGSSAPDGWLFCDGSEISRDNYATLFTAIGTQYGSGNENTTFNLPDLRYSFLRGSASQLTLTGDGSQASAAPTANVALIGVPTPGIFTLNNHGLTDGSIIQFKALSNLTSITLNTNYYIINSTTNTFQISTTFNGTAANVTRPTTLTSTATLKNIVKFTAHGVNRTGLKLRVSTLGSLTGLAVSTDYYAIVINENYLGFTTNYSEAVNNKLSAATLQSIGGTTTSTVIVQYEDPDNSTRNKAASGGNTSGLGTRQDDQLQSHTHTFPLATDDALGSRGADGSVGGATATSSSTGGNETRPNNIYINYIIKI